MNILNIVADNSKDARKEEIMAKNKLKPDLVKKYEEIFQSYEREEDSGYVLVKDVPSIMKILGVSISEQEIIDLIGDRVSKNENPLVSSKIDFLDFLGLFVFFSISVGGKRQWNRDERRINGGFPSVWRWKLGSHSCEPNEILFKEIRNCHFWGWSRINPERQWSGRRVRQVRKVH